MSSCPSCGGLPAVAAKHDTRMGAIQQDLLAGNSIVMNRGDVDEVWRGFVKCAPTSFFAYERPVSFVLLAFLKAPY